MTPPLPQLDRTDPGESVARADVARDPRLAMVPHGALALAGLMASLLLAGWLAMYFGLFLARGGVS